MLTLLLRRAGFSLLSLVLVTSVLFVLTQAIPDSPARIVLGQDATDAQVTQFEHDHGLDRPVIWQYAAWVDRLALHGSLGNSFITGRPVGPDIVATLPVTLELVVIAFVLFAWAVGGGGHIVGAAAGYGAGLCGAVGGGVGGLDSRVLDGAGADPGAGGRS